VIDAGFIQSSRCSDSRKSTPPVTRTEPAAAGRTPRRSVGFGSLRIARPDQRPDQRRAIDQRLGEHRREFRRRAEPEFGVQQVVVAFQPDTGDDALERSEAIHKEITQLKPNWARIEKDADSLAEIARRTKDQLDRD
jgi:hypothetical protein